jgi:alkylglycerol monooxygenase
METINVYAIVTPAVLVLILVEFIYCLVKKNGYYTFQDSLIGVGTSIVTQCVNVAVTVAVLIVYGWIYKNYAIFHIEFTPVNLILCYVIGDFLFYWFHRAGHRVNFLWAAHVPHHSAEELNYAVALRASFTQRAASFLFYWPLAILGVSPDLILILVAINLVYQLIPHTRVIGKLPAWISSWLNTPYHHQVHHAANRIYWDKNYGGTLIIWDRLFGTYQDQTEPVYYGVAIHPKSWDSVYLNFHWFFILWNDMLAADHWVDKIKIWFMPPGWRPRNLPPYPKDPPHTAATQVKYQTPALKNSSGYLVVQLLIALATMLLVIRPDSFLSIIEKVILSFLLLWTVTSWGQMLESKSFAKNQELIRIIVQGIFLDVVFRLHHHQDEFLAINAIITLTSFFWMTYFVKDNSFTKSA